MNVKIIPSNHYNIMMNLHKPANYQLMWINHSSNL